jgi:hypothetical protein
MQHLATHQKRREGTQHSKEKKSQSVNKLGVKKNSVVEPKLFLPPSTPACGAANSNWGSGCGPGSE